MRFIALDPSSLNIGWAIFQDDSLVIWGNICAEKQEFAGRFLYLTEQLSMLKKAYNYEEIATEETQWRWKGREIASLRVAFMSIRKWAESQKIPWFQYNVATWKTSVVGDTHASKDQIAAVVKMVFPSLPPGMIEHEYDAIGVGIYHSGLRRFEAMGGPTLIPNKKRGKKK